MVTQDLLLCVLLGIHLHSLSLNKVLFNLLNKTDSGTIQFCELIPADGLFRLEQQIRQVQLLELHHPSSIIFNRFLQERSRNNRKLIYDVRMNKQVNMFNCEWFIISEKWAVNCARQKLPERGNHFTNTFPYSLCHTQHALLETRNMQSQTTIGEMLYDDNNNLQFVNIRSGTTQHSHPHACLCNSLFISLNKNAIIQNDCSRLWKV